MKTQLRKKALTLAVAACLGVSGAAMANETSSAVKGQIMGPNGNPAAGTKVTIIHVPSGSTKIVEVNDAGYFSVKGLRVGGPYQVIVDSDTFEDTMVENVYLSLGNDYPVNVALNAKTNMEQIVVTGNVISSMSGGTGPASTFTLSDLESAPAINRDLKDIVRADPRVYVDDSRGAIQCGGGNPRYNSLTLDGVRMNDNFGLSSNGYPTIRAPFSFDSIEQVAVELAPFDVQYGGFTSCNINAVTKSGTNEVHGGFFYDFTSDSLKGDKIKDESVDNGNYTEKRYGFNVGLPLIQDTLFLFTSYEKLDGIAQLQYDGLSTGSVSQAELDRIIKITRDTYGYDAGSMPGSMPVGDEKVLVKLDWNINSDHRASLVYNWNDGYTLSQSDSGGDTVSLDSHFYEQGAEFTSIIGSVYSDWNSNFSTEVRIGKSKLDARVESLDAASSFGEFRINTTDGGRVYIGPDDSRQSNDLNYDTTTFKVAGTYYLDQHTLTAGYEFEELDVFNLFMQHSQGEFVFDSVDDYAAGLAGDVYYNNAAGTNNPNDVAAAFAYAQHTFYIQDEYSFDNIDATLTFGLRYDKYTSDDKPNYNKQFEDRYNFSNQKNMDGIDLLQPRVGFNWSASEDLEVRAGMGLYSGGNPNVWVSNAYSNDGVTQIGRYAGNIKLFDIPMTNGGKPGYEVPQFMFDAIQNTPIGQGDGTVNAIAQDFEIPSEWKYAVGATYILPDDYTVSVDLLHTQKRNSAILTDIAQRDSGKNAFDGRPIYESIEGRSGELLLDNVSGDDGESTILSAALSKEYDNGINFTVSYAYTDSKDVNPMTSSTASSNYGNLATTNPGNPGVATSDYEVPHRFTLQLGYKVELFEGYTTRFNLFGQASQGQPYSFTFDGADSQFGDANSNRSRQLVYIPLVDDPNVVYTPYSKDPVTGKETGFDKALFDQFIESEGLTRGAIAGRNSNNADWFTKVDLRVSQQIPGFMDGHKGEVFFVINNLTNLLNSDWGTMEKGGFVGNRMVKAKINAEGKYEYNTFNARNANLSVQRDASLWEMRLGVNYRF